MTLYALRVVLCLSLSIFALLFPPCVSSAACVPSAEEVGGHLRLRLPYRSGEEYRVSQGYCGQFHTRGYEVDFALPVGTVVVAAADGMVEDWGTYSQNCNPDTQNCGLLSSRDQGGLFIRLRHESDVAGQYYYSSYLHLSAQESALLHKGVRVAAGQALGLSGNTGASTGPHLHFHIRTSLSADDGVRPTPTEGLVVSTMETTITDFQQSDGATPFLYRATGSAAFTAEDLVEVVGRRLQGLPPLPTRGPDACSPITGAVEDGRRGTIIEGPVFCDAFNRWRVRWNDGLTEGWVAQNWIRKVRAAEISREYGFVRITLGAAEDEADTFVLTVSEYVAGDVLFRLSNNGTHYSVIHDIYFDNDPRGPLQEMTLNVENMENPLLHGVSFNSPGGLSFLPGANNNPLTPFFALQGNFNPSTNLWADADNPEAHLGANGGEAAGISFTLRAGKTLQSVFDALAKAPPRPAIPKTTLTLSP